ncbi:MAG: glycosyltransferase family 2 protein [Gemmatimonadaceae bacterium]
MISLVVPAYNEADGVEELHRRIAAAAPAWGEDWELIVVDDGSHDQTLQILERLAASDPHLKVVSLSRNFGHQPAVTAGLNHARGSIVCVMDADLQDPPEELLPFIAKVREGMDVVYAIRTKRKEGVLKRMAYHVYYRLLKRLATLDIPLDSGDFCVMRGEVVRAINQLPERNRFIRGLRTWVGYQQSGLAYERAARYAGEPKYTLRKLLRLASDGIINFSYRPLQAIMLLGFAVGTIAILLGMVVLVQYAGDFPIAGYNPRQARGWTSLILVLLFSSAIQLFCLGILGEYIGRLFEETKRRPIYLVKKRIGVEPPDIVNQ